MIDGRIAECLESGRRRQLVILAQRFGFVAGAFALTLWFRHWTTWAAFGTYTFLQAVTTFATFIALSHNRRFRSELESGATELAWIHAFPLKKGNFYRVSLFGYGATDYCYVAVSSAVAASTISAGRELGLKVTTTPEEEDEHKEIYEIDKMAVKLERMLAETTGKNFRALGPSIADWIFDWRQGPRTFRSDAERDSIKAKLHDVVFAFEASALGKSGFAQETFGQDAARSLKALYAVPGVTRAPTAKGPETYAAWPSRSRLVAKSASSARP